MGEITFNASEKENDWFLKISDEGIKFNKEKYPSSSPDDFANAFISLLEMKFKVKFDKSEPPYDKK